FMIVISIVIALVSLSRFSGAQTQTKIVLRNLTILEDVDVIEFDESNVQLSNGKKLEWDQVLDAKIDSDRQQQFDNYVQKIGRTLFRIELRLSRQDWVGAAELCDVLSQTPNEFGKIPQRWKYLTALSKYRNHLEKGNRPAALLEFLSAAKLQPVDLDLKHPMLSEVRLTDSEIRFQISDQILPIWFDLSAAEKIEKEMNPMIDDRPGGLIYLASLRLSGSEFESAVPVLERLAEFRDGPISRWTKLLAIQLELRRGKKMESQSELQTVDLFQMPTKPLAMYFAASAVEPSQNTSNDFTTEIDRKKASVAFLKIPAIFEESYPTLSAAACHRCACLLRSRGLKQESQILLQELFRRYPQTYHGKLVLETKQP
ncbi:MAG: hypothetical protein AAF623_11820, partial [Planctomycetota bacterium]